MLIAPIVADAAAPGPIRLVSHVPASPVTTSGQHAFVQGASSDGAYVVFTSRSSGLVAGQADSNAWHDVFLWERATGTITLVSHIPGSNTITGNAPSEVAAISDDGAYVAFVSYATNLVAGQTDFIETTDLFLWERATGTVRLISHAANSATTTVGADGSSTSLDINATGSSVVWLGYASNIVTGQAEGNASSDVFLYDRATGTNVLVSRIPASPTTTGTGSSHEPSISADGGFVAFRSYATNLVTGQVQGTSDSNLSLWTRATGAMALVSHAAGSPTAAAQSEPRVPR